MPATKKKGMGGLLISILGVLLLAASFDLIGFTVALAEPSESVEITGNGVTAPVTFTLNQLQEMEQYRHVYSTINTWPTKRWYVGEGVKLKDLLALAGIKEDAKLIKFTSNDGYTVTLTVQELLKDKRYYFPHFKDNSAGDGSVPGSPKDAEEVEPILALASAEDSNNPADMNDMNSLLLMLGQRAVTEQTNPLFLKYTTKIEVLTDEPPKWDNPRANIAGGNVPEGAKIILSNKHNDTDKIYYTTDGSTPTVNSPIFNWSAKRWWSLRPDGVDSINRPVEIKENTVIKAITIGPGKLDSDVITFTYTVDHTISDQVPVPGGPATGVTLDQEAADVKVGSIIELTAIVSPDNALDKRVTWSSSDTSVATVDNNGLVTVVGPGTALITVKTVDGGLTATCLVHAKDTNNTGTEDKNNAGADTALVLSEPPKNEEQEISPKAGGGQVAKVPAEKKPPSPPPVPEGDWRYLADKEEVAAGAARNGVSLPEPDSQPWGIFEMSAGAVPLQVPEKQNSQNVWAAVIFLALFLSGAGVRYKDYAREVAR